MGQTIATTFLSRNIMDIPVWDFFVFRQDGAPALRARDTVAFLERKVFDFIPHSPDLNPVDYSIYSVLQEKVYLSRIANVDELKTRLIDEWKHFDRSIVDAGNDQWWCRLSVCFRESRAHFEHKFKQTYKFSYFAIYLPKVTKLMES